MNDYSTREAEAIGRHIKAALLHLRQAEDIAEAAGIDLDASEHDPGPAGQFRAASQAVQELDMWAIGNAREHGAVPAQTYEHTERWCHASDGQLPATSWPAEYDAATSEARVPLESEEAAPGRGLPRSRGRSGTGAGAVSAGCRPGR